jgi:transposase
MAEERREFDQDFLEGVVRLLRETGKPIAQAARGPGHQRGHARELAQCGQPPR